MNLPLNWQPLMDLFGAYIGAAAGLGLLWLAARKGKDHAGSE